MGGPSEWLVPDWPLPAGIHALFTTRDGGVSVSPFDSFNLGDHVRDDPLAVTTNRQRLQEATGARPVFLSQVHGVEVATLDGATPDGTEADACLTGHPGVACTVMVADCLPVLWCLPDGSAVAASHAGWRGLAGQDGHGILETTMQALQVLSATAAAPLVWLGPCIGPRAFEVGAEVREAFVSVDADATRCFEALPAEGKYLANLPALARLRLGAMGVTKVFGNDGSDAWCTVTQSSRFFSHRRDAARLGSTGRMAACIWKV
ncbi:peptidoglycan editing factor PgeF [Hydrogenophaga flava]|uniref:peptidoglycan editing factor PgeF n=1 Tax=Hydrogenophaga flava TaxID=65657 RepID=UPI000826BCB1|nr:peptidoglycan editing factor PgeF [Hydrogenophaga flava]